MLCCKAGADLEVFCWKAGVYPEGCHGILECRGGFREFSLVDPESFPWHALGKCYTSIIL